MSKEFKLPELGEDVEEGDVLKVLVEPGDTVDAEQTVLEIETDKATLEVPIDFAGRVEEVKVNEGDHIRVGEVLLVLSTDGDRRRDEEKEEGEEKEEKPEAKRDEEVAKAKEKKRPKEEKQKVEEEEAEEVEKEPEPEEEEEASKREPEKPKEPKRKPSGPPEPRSAESVPAAPSVRRFARELGVDLTEVEGTGPGGRLSMEDVKAAAKTIVTTTGVGHAPKLPDFGRWGELRRERLSGLRRAAIRNLARSWSQVAHVTHHDRADITTLQQSMERYGERVEKAGGKLTVTAVAIYIAATALRKFPTFNASLDVANDELIFKKYRHIGVAVDTERGLVVPVIRNADRMSIREIAVALGALSEQARSGKLSRDDMEGGSFTVTNLGGIGGTSFTPIVNWPEVAILGVSRGRREPSWTGNGFEPRVVLPLSLSYDHRVIDGADAARFLRFVAEAFEDSFFLSLEGATG